VSRSRDPGKREAAPHGRPLRETGSDYLISTVELSSFKQINSFSSKPRTPGSSSVGRLDRQ